MLSDVSSRSFQITSDINSRGKYTLELNIVSFNGWPANYDIRRWGLNAAGERYPARGISLTSDELQALKDQLDAMEIYLSWISLQGMNQVQS